MTQQDSEKSKDVRSTNITAARAVADVVRTSLGPRGMDKMVSTQFNSKPLLLDPRLKGKSHHHQRWCHNSQADGSHPSNR